MSTAKKIRVLIVDDSAVVRKLASDALSADPEIEVVGTAIDPYMARDKLRELSPDVMTLDLEMPRMDGLTFLRLLMERRPMPVIVLSSLTQRGSEFALEALRLGAVDVLGKPTGQNSFAQLGPQLIAMVKTAAVARVKAITPSTDLPRVTTSSPFPSTPSPAANHPGSSTTPIDPARLRQLDPRSIILLGASTGGTEALREVLVRLPGDLPGIAIVQHIPAAFSKAFANRLNSLCAMEVREAADGDLIRPGLALVAPGNFHLLIKKSGEGYRVRVIDGPQIWHQRPAVDLLFKSASDCGAAPYTLAGVLTGMGKDGADGLRRLRDRGATTFAQDEASSIVYGMPRAAWEQGGAKIQVSLKQIAPYILSRCDAALHSTDETALSG
ncbi:MAG: chemotaxis response regulator protein-glutamate methylesterase [Candidatus Didemnitutus sp.]|nr:chemotaxis response regulator protein-glutamate methylesterase [Candidatus Didemnitutus sp.]